MDEGKKPFFAARRSSVESSPSPPLSATSGSSSTSASPRCSIGAPRGTRNPVRYQLDGRTQPGNRSSASGWLAHGPIRSSRSAWTIASRTSADSAGRVMSLPIGEHSPQRQFLRLSLPPLSRAFPLLDSGVRCCYVAPSTATTFRSGRADREFALGSAWDGCFWASSPSKSATTIEPNPLSDFESGQSATRM